MDLQAFVRGAAMLCCVCTVPPVGWSQMQPNQMLAGAAVVSQIELPEAPSSSLALPRSGDSDTAEDQASIAVPAAVARKFSTNVKPGQTALPLSASDKFQMGIRKQLTLGGLASPAISAGLGNLKDSRPHYGIDAGAYGERLGAAALRETSQAVFYYGVYSNLFHSDPRYYVLGPQHPFKKRVVYAASRVLITRKDGGGRAPNWALFSAVASSSALSNVYYPPEDRDFRRSVATIFTSLAVRMGTQQLREFSGDIRQRLHLKR